MQRDGQVMKFFFFSTTIKIYKKMPKSKIIYFSNIKMCEKNIFLKFFVLKTSFYILIIYYFS